MLDYYGSCWRSIEEVDRELIQSFRKKAHEHYIKSIIADLRQEKIIAEEYTVSGWMVFHGKTIHEIIAKRCTTQTQINEKKLRFLFCYNQLFKDIDVCRLICDKLICDKLICDKLICDKLICDKL